MKKIRKIGVLVIFGILVLSLFPINFSIETKQAAIIPVDMIECMPTCDSSMEPASIYLGEIESLDFENIQKTFHDVFFKLPDEVMIYPSENYLYFRFNAAGKEIWGNLRLSPRERDEGLVHFAYYEFNPDPQGPDDVHFKYKLLSPEDGLNINKLNDFCYQITYEGKIVTFNLYQLTQTPPTHFDIPLGEDVLFNSYDESRFQFYLMFNTQSHHFMWVLNEDEVVPDQLIPVRHDILVGQKSKFAFYIDNANQDRKILIGVGIDNIKQNNYYDGPFDQLADNYIDTDSKLSDYIQQAYPYTQGRVDEYGKFIDIEGSRVAITPYAAYTSTTELTSIVDWSSNNRDGDEFYFSIAYDDKSRFGPPAPSPSTTSTLKEIGSSGTTRSLQPPGPTHDYLLTKYNIGHSIRVTKTWPEDHKEEWSRSWPPNHVYARSMTWPEPHDEERSLSWPPNHKGSRSRTWPPGHTSTNSLKWPTSHGWARSLSWPPNHNRINSRTWPDDHDRDKSRTWPRNHRSARSQTWPDGHTQARSPSWPHNHQGSVSESWPNGHTSPVSRGWGSRHTQARSLTWPPEHRGGDSNTWPQPHDQNPSNSWPSDHRQYWSSRWPSDHTQQRSQSWPANHRSNRSQVWPN